MAASLALYDAFRRGSVDGTFDLDGDTFKVALLSSSYTPNMSSHSALSDISAHEVTGAGYAAGGAAVTNQGLSVSAGKVRWALSTPTWTALTATMRYAVIYKVGIANDVTNPLVGLVTLDSADVAVNGVDYAVLWTSGCVVEIG